MLLPSSTHNAPAREIPSTEPEQLSSSLSPLRASLLNLDKSRSPLNSWQSAPFKPLPPHLLLCSPSSRQLNPAGHCADAQDTPDKLCPQGLQACSSFWSFHQLPCGSLLHHIIISVPHVCAKSLQSSLMLCDLMDCRPAASSVHGILQARIPEWVAMPSSRGSSRCSDRMCVS